MEGLTHLNEQGRAKMVNVGDKNITDRRAVAMGRVYMKPGTLELVEKGGIKKGDVLAVAQVAGIMGAKKTADIIPMCHPLNINGIDIAFETNRHLLAVEIRAEVGVAAKTGVEMEALTAVSVAALAIYDMCKAVDKEMIIGDIQLLEKAGGRSGRFVKEVKTNEGKGNCR
ncbi:MAG: cyclic pyranopterin monophosphate synthase MoaC [Clostridiales bacterium]|nr:cyclic pyranopterin monophosphate synthase MoaC [Clostridiales bacterium]